MFIRQRATCFAAVLILAGSPVASAQDAVLRLPLPLDLLDGDAPPQQAHPKWQSRRPATQPAGDAQLQRWFGELAASDAALRTRALSALLDLTRADLPALRRVVERSRPLSPSQAGALRDVVNHVYLSGESYDCEPRVGFLGLILPALESVEVPRAADDDKLPRAAHDGMNELGRASTGVPVDYRIPGFCAYRALRDGDVVLRIVHPIPRRLRDWNDLTYSIKAFPAGERLTLEVLRQGAVVEVPVTLDAKPLVANEQVWSAVVLPAREAAAEAYWDEHFAPLMSEDKVSAAQAAGTHASAPPD